MTYTAFILSVWSAMLSAAAMGGQLYFRIIARPIPLTDIQAAERVVEDPKLAASIAVLLFYLPVFISSFLVLRHIKRTGRAEALIFTALAFDTFSLMYGLFLYGLLARY